MENTQDPSTENGKLFSRWEVGAAQTGLIAGVAIISLGCLGASTGLVGYVPWRNFVSELSLPTNPVAWRLNVAFMVGGVLLAVSLGLLVRSVRGSFRVSAVCGAGSALCFGLVGVYPIDKGVHHVAAACGAVLAGLVASIFFAVGVARVAKLDAFKKRLVYSLVAIQIASVVGGTAAGIWMVRSGKTPLRYLFFSGAGQIENPFAPNSTINPLTIAEWAFFLAALVLVLAIAIGAPSVLTSRGRLAQHRSQTGAESPGLPAD